MTRLVIDAMAAGGDAIGRLDGKAVFVPGAIPGDVVDVEIEQNRKRYARARLTGIVDASDDRIDMPCPHAEVCGGCSWQMVDRAVQLGWKQQAVVDAMERIGRLGHVPVRPIAAPGPAYRYRNRLDLHPSPAGPGFYTAGSHTTVAVGTCHLAAPPVELLLQEYVGRPLDEPLTLRAGLRTGTELIVGGGREGPVESITEVVDGVGLRITGRSFFQPNTDGAETLVALVSEAVGDAADGLFVDAYAGVGLFAGTVGRPFAEVVAIEVDPSAVADLVENAGGAHVLETTAAEGLMTLARSPGVVIVDPPRTGLGPETTAAVLEAAPDVIVAVSCDAATFARDARALVLGGYELEWVQPVDQFPQTPHVETVARFVR